MSASEIKNIAGTLRAKAALAEAERAPNALAAIAAAEAAQAEAEAAQAEAEAAIDSMKEANAAVRKAADSIAAVADPADITAEQVAALTAAVADLALPDEEPSDGE